MFQGLQLNEPAADDAEASPFAFLARHPPSFGDGQPPHQKRSPFDFLNSAAATPVAAQPRPHAADASPKVVLPSSSPRSIPLDASGALAFQGFDATDVPPDDQAADAPLESLLASASGSCAQPAAVSSIPSKATTPSANGGFQGFGDEEESLSRPKKKTSKARRPGWASKDPPSSAESAPPPPPIDLSDLSSLEPSPFKLQHATEPPTPAAPLYFEAPADSNATQPDSFGHLAQNSAGAQKPQATPSPRQALPADLFNSVLPTPPRAVDVPTAQAPHASAPPTPSHATASPSIADSAVTAANVVGDAISSISSFFGVSQSTSLLDGLTIRSPRAVPTTSRTSSQRTVSPMTTPATLLSSQDGGATKACSASASTSPTSDGQAEPALAAGKLAPSELQTTMSNPVRPHVNHGAALSSLATPEPAVGTSSGLTKTELRVHMAASSSQSIKAAPQPDRESVARLCATQLERIAAWRAARSEVTSLESQQIAASTQDDFDRAEELEASLERARGRVDEASLVLAEVNAALAIYEAEVEAACTTDTEAHNSKLLLEQTQRDAAVTELLQRATAMRERMASESQRIAIESERLSQEATRLSIDAQEVDARLAELEHEADSCAAAERKERDEWLAKRGEAECRFAELRLALEREEALIVKCDEKVHACEREISSARSGYDKSLTRLQRSRDGVAQALTECEAEREALRAQRDDAGRARREEREERHRRRAELAEILRRRSVTRESAARASGFAQALQATRAARRGWEEHIMATEAAMAPLDLECDSLKDALARVSEQRLALQGEVAALHQASSSATAQVEEVNEQKAAAIAARSFKEAGKLTTTLRTLQAEAYSRNEAFGVRRTELEYAKIALKALRAASGDADACARAHRLDLDVRTKSVLRREVASAYRRQRAAELLLHPEGESMGTEVFELLRAWNESLRQHLDILDARLGNECECADALDPEETEGDLKTNASEDIESHSDAEAWAVAQAASDDDEASAAVEIAEAGEFAQSGGAQGVEVARFVEDTISELIDETISSIEDSTSGEFAKSEANAPFSPASDVASGDELVGPRKSGDGALKCESATKAGAQEQKTYSHASASPSVGAAEVNEEEAPNFEPSAQATIGMSDVSDESNGATNELQLLEERERLGASIEEAIEKEDFDRADMLESRRCEVERQLEKMGEELL